MASTAIFPLYKQNTHGLTFPALALGAVLKPVRTNMHAFMMFSAFLLHRPMLLLGILMHYVTIEHPASESSCTKSRGSCRARRTNQLLAIAGRSSSGLAAIPSLCQGSPSFLCPSCRTGAVLVVVVRSQASRLSSGLALLAIARLPSRC